MSGIGYRNYLVPAKNGIISRAPPAPKALLTVEHFQISNNLHFQKVFYSTRVSHPSWSVNSLRQHFQTKSCRHFQITHYSSWITQPAPKPTFTDNFSDHSSYISRYSSNPLGRHFQRPFSLTFTDSLPTNNLPICEKL